MCTESPVRLRRKVEGGEEVRTASVEASVGGALQHPHISRRAALGKPYILSAICHFPILLPLFTDELQAIK